MIFPSNLLLLLLVITIVVAIVSSTGIHVYVTNLKPIVNTKSGVFGKVIIFTNDNINGSISYNGYANGLQMNLGPINCTALNGCGVHIHNGTSCTDLDTQGGHYYVDPITVDPWIEVRYSSNSNGSTTFSGIVNIGTKNIEGKPFISKCY